MANFQMPKQMRELFVTILYFCEPKGAKALWKKFKAELSEDFLYRTHDQKLSIQMAKADLEYQLNNLGRSLLDYKIKLPTMNFGPRDEDLFDPEEELRKGKEMRDKMKGSIQEKVVKKVMLNIYL